ncbi:MAG: Wzz/FepE/Etk N-terminal domain-containing protein [Actinomycetota bacterium]|nr:Wzz/FepE/Etk N-terminal domain-containing protein [Actinomycetota bacterium]
MRLVASPEAITQRSYLSVLRRRPLVVVAGVLLGVVLALGFGALATPTYSAEAAVLVQPITSDPFAPSARPAELVNMATEAEIIRSTTVINLAARRLDLRRIDLETVRERLVVAPAVDALVLRIEYDDPNPKRAAEWAQALSQSYLEYRQQQAVRIRDQSVGNVDDQIADVAATLATNPNVAGLMSWLGELERRRAALVALPTIPGEILRPAETPTSPSGTPPWVTQLGALGLCTLLGFAAAVVLDRRDDRFGSSSEVAEIAEPVLGLVPASGRVATIPLLAALDGRHADPYRRLRVKLLRSAQPLRKILVTAPGHTEQAIADVAVHLAMTMAASGTNTALVWATTATRASSLPAPAARPVALDPRAPGLSELLTGEVPVREVLRPVPDLPALMVVPPQFQRPVLSHDELERLRQVVDVELLLQELVELVIVAGPAIFAMSDVLELAAMVDGVVVAINPATTNRRDLDAAVGSLRDAGGAYLGAVVVGTLAGW